MIPIFELFLFSVQISSISSTIGHSLCPLKPYMSYKYIYNETCEIGHIFNILHDKSLAYPYQYQLLIYQHQNE